MYTRYGVLPRGCSILRLSVKMRAQSLEVEFGQRLASHLPIPACSISAIWSYIAVTKVFIGLDFKPSYCSLRGRGVVRLSGVIHRIANVHSCLFFAIHQAE